MILAAYGMNFVSGVVTNVKITTLACSLQPNKKIKADKKTSLINPVSNPSHRWDLRKHTLGCTCKFKCWHKNSW